MQTVALLRYGPFRYYDGLQRQHFGTRLDVLIEILENYMVFLSKWNFINPAFSYFLTR